MTILLADLVSRLTADVPAVSGVPSSGQYSQAVLDAVADLSRRASVPRIVTLSVIAGTAAYAVPKDFEKLIRLAALGVPISFGSSYLEYGQYNGWGWGNDPRGGVVVAPSGLVPFAGSYREQITVSGATLTIYPTPQTSADRQLVYAAGDALNDSQDGYDTLTDDRAAIALLLAKATCLERIASSPTMQAIKVAGLGFETDKRTQAQALHLQAQSAREAYLAAVDSLNAANGGLG